LGCVFFEPRTNAALIVALALDDLSCDEAVRLANQGDGGGRGRIIQGSAISRSRSRPASRSL
jgi:hypothetical protein